MTYEEFLDTIENEENKEKFSSMIEKIKREYPDLNLEIKWSQPMFTMEGTFIIGFSVSKNHMAVSGEKKAIDYFKEYLHEKNFSYGQMIIRMPWEKEIDHDLINMIIDYNMRDKKGYKKFWRQ